MGEGVGALIGTVVVAVVVIILRKTLSEEAITGCSLLCSVLSAVFLIIFMLASRATMCGYIACGLAGIAMLFNEMRYTVYGKDGETRIGSTIKNMILVPFVAMLIVAAAADFIAPWAGLVAIIVECILIQSGAMEKIGFHNH